MKSTECKTPLGKQMLERAERDNLPHAHELRLRAIDIEELMPDQGAKRLLGRWARARRVWSDYTGEPLV